MTKKFSTDLEKVIRARAELLIGPWPDGLRMSVLANDAGFKIDLGTASTPTMKHNRSRVMQIISAIKLEIRYGIEKQSAQLRSLLRYRCSHLSSRSFLPPSMPLLRLEPYRSRRIIILPTLERRS